jgi:putative ABC transport system substrate-binding protein
MRRRDFIAGLVLAASSRDASAQQKTKVNRIALVHPSDAVEDLSEARSPYYRAFFQRLGELGYVEGQNLVVQRHSGEGRTEYFSEVAAEVVQSRPDLIFAVGNRLTNAVAEATSTIPVVAVVGDPIAGGIAVSLARPGRNITGVTVETGSDIMSKYLELLREMVPAASRVVWLASRRLWEMSYAAPLQETAQKMKISLLGPALETPIQEPEYRRVFAAMAQEGADALFVSNQPENFTNVRLIVALAEKAQLPAIYQYSEGAEVGGLMAYSPDFSDMFRRVADQADQILKGEKAGEIPFYQPTKFVLTINLKTAKALGITVPTTLLIAADEVIE